MNTIPCFFLPGVSVGRDINNQGEAEFDFTKQEKTIQKINTGLQARQLELKFFKIIWECFGVSNETLRLLLSIIPKASWKALAGTKQTTLSPEDEKSSLFDIFTEFKECAQDQTFQYEKSSFVDVFRNYKKGPTVEGAEQFSETFLREFVVEAFADFLKKHGNTTPPDIEIFFKQELELKQEPELNQKLELLQKGEWKKEFRQFVPRSKAFGLGQVPVDRLLSLMVVDRAFLTPPLAAFLGDIFIYLNERSKIQTFIQEEFKKTLKTQPSNCTHCMILCHSFGGVIFWDMFQSGELDEVFAGKTVHLISVGSQIAFFDLLHLYTQEKPDRKQPLNLGSWLNCFDKVDVFAFSAESHYSVFQQKGILKDVYIETKGNSISSHSAYFENNTNFIDAVKKHVETKMTIQ